MDCYYHQGRENTDNCAICKKPICKECGLEISGNVYCKDCLEKIVGGGLQNSAAQENIPKQPEPAQYQENIPKQPEPAQYQENPYDTIKTTPQEPIEFKENPYETRTTNTPIVEKPPSLERQDPIENQNYPPREEFVPMEEKTYKEEDFIYPDHSHQPNERLEKKYEDYLNELYEEPDIPLHEQLARDEEKYGPLTQKPYVESTYEETIYPEHNESFNSINEDPIINSRNPNYPETGRSRQNNIHYKEENKKEGTIVDTFLTITLVILIIIVVLYIIYLLFLSSAFPSFTEAIFGLF